MKAALRILSAVICMLLVSCIDGREEYWIGADGSGCAEITYTLPATAVRICGGDASLRGQITGLLGNTPGVTGYDCWTTTENDRVTIHVNTEFKSAMDFKQLAVEGSPLPSAATHLIGDIRADLHGRTLDFSRTISPSKALPGSSLLPASQFEGRRLTYIMHLPAAVVESNATRVEDSGRTLIWDLPLADAVKAPVVTRFRMDVPIPWKLVTSIALPLSLAGGLVIRKIRRSRKNPTAGN